MTSKIKVDTIEEKTSGNGVVIDSVTLKDGAITATTADNTDTLTLTSTDADANSGPNLRLYRNSGSPAVGDNLGQIDFEGRNDNSEDVVYASMMARARDETDGTEDGGFQIDIMQGGTLRSLMKYYSDGSAQELSFNDDSRDVDFRVESDTKTHMFFVDGGNDKIGVNSSSVESTFHVIGTSTNTAAKFEQNSANEAMVVINNSRADDGSEISMRFERADVVQGAIGTTGQGISFWTNSSIAERMRINSNGNIQVGTTTELGRLHLSMPTTAGTDPVIHFSDLSGTDCGSIDLNASANTVAYTTSSDYRLKENVDYDFDATKRLKQLKPARFNFKNNPNETVDGFLAHEVSDVVALAVTGVKDETKTKTKVVLNSQGNLIAEGIEESDWIAGKTANDDGNTKYPIDSTWEESAELPVYQGIDQSKLVPLMVKTIQELEARITELENAE